MSKSRSLAARFPTFLVMLGAAVLAGALFWAKGRDPFERDWFTLKIPSGEKFECVRVSPRATAPPWPIVLYFHGANGTILGSGDEVRQMAEMGLAVVAVEYSQTNQGKFGEQVIALQEYLVRHAWADTNRIAWVGMSLGAQRTLALLSRQPEIGPKLLVRLAGGWVPELGERESRAQRSGASTKPLGTSVLLVHGEQDEVFALSDAQRVAACLRSNAVPVELRVLPGRNHRLEPDRLLVFRVLGEQCLMRLKGADALSSYRSILSWQAQAKPLWLFWTPALIWVAVWLWLRRKTGQASRLLPGKPEQGSRGRSPCRWEVGVCWLAAVLAAAAVAQTALHLVPPWLPVSERMLGIARKHLVSPKQQVDFAFLAAKPFWPGKRLKILLEHVELANYNRELINWKLDEQMYQQFVLSPEIDPVADGDLDWRRPLWENFYPRIRKEQGPEAAAEIVVRFLRERVTIADGSGLPAAVAETWQRQITNERGFEAIYVAAMRSVGIPARLGARNRAELFAEGKWQLAPRPLVEKWE